jgi:L-lactate permease
MPALQALSVRVLVRSSLIKANYLPEHADIINQMHVRGALAAIAKRHAPKKSFTTTIKSTEGARYDGKNKEALNYAGRLIPAALDL